MRPILFSLGSLNFYSYGALTALGFVAAAYLLRYLAKRKRLYTSKHRDYFLIDTILISLISGVLLARLAYFFLYRDASLVGELSFWRNLVLGGFVFYPGLLGGVTAFWIWLSRHAEPLPNWFDCLIPAIFCGLTFNEFGAYLNDGYEYHLVGSLLNLVFGLTTVQTALIEKKNGRAFWLGLVFLFVSQFFLAFWRTELYQIGVLGLGQIFSLIGIVYASYFFFKHLIYVK